MLKRIVTSAIFSVLMVNLSADVLHKDEVARFQALTGLSQVESQECFSLADAYVSQLYRMGYSDKEIDSIIKQQVGAASKKAQDAHADCVGKKTMWLLLAATVVISASVAATAAVSSYVFVKINEEIN